jgi:hypothetical protein
VNLKNEKVATDTRKWYRATRDFSTEFDPDFLSILKPGLVAYADQALHSFFKTRSTDNRSLRTIKYTIAKLLGR